MNIDTWCANSSYAKGRVERAHLTLRYRLVTLNIQRRRTSCLTHNLLKDSIL